MEILKVMDLRERTLVRIVKVLGGMDLYYRNEKNGQIEIVYIAKHGGK
jgi:hypothetical protein